MKAAAQIELFNLIQEITQDKNKAERIVTLVIDEAIPGNDELKKVFLTKEDKTDIFNRLDSHFKWLVGIMIGLFALAVALFKIL